MDKETAMVYKKLNTFNLMDILESCYSNGDRDAWEVRDKICDLYPELTETLYDLTLDEFMDYLTVKYPVHFCEVTHYVLKMQTLEDFQGILEYFQGDFQ